MAPNETERQPLLNWVLLKYPNTPRTRAKQWILAGRVSVGGAMIRRPHELLPDPGETLELLTPQSASLELGRGRQIHPLVALLHLDSALAIVNKGPGLLSVPASNQRMSALTLLGDFLAGRLKPQDRSAAHRVPSNYARLEPLRVHRLDQYTSGLLCFAMNPTARENLIEQVRTHSMSRVYIAFVEGKPPKPKGVWRHWLRLSSNQMRQEVVSRPQAAASEAEVQEAVTYFEVLAEYPVSWGRGFVSKLQLKLETGLRHQLRVQAAEVGLPLVGDRTYNPACHGRATVSPKLPFSRQALHAVRIELVHPGRSGQRMDWSAPLPEDLRQLEATLRSR